MGYWGDYGWGGYECVDVWVGLCVLYTQVSVSGYQGNEQCEVFYENTTIDKFSNSHHNLAIFQPASLNPRPHSPKPRRRFPPLPKLLLPNLAMSLLLHCHNPSIKSFRLKNFFR